MHANYPLHLTIIRCLMLGNRYLVTAQIVPTPQTLLCPVDAGMSQPTTFEVPRVSRRPSSVIRTSPATKELSKHHAVSSLVLIESKLASLVRCRRTGKCSMIARFFSWWPRRCTYIEVRYGMTAAQRSGPINKSREHSRVV
jgi:hypothetical protein